MNEPALKPIIQLTPLGIDSNWFHAVPESDFRFGKINGEFESRIFYAYPAINAQRQIY